MTLQGQGKRFRRDVFPAELEEVRRRRREAGDERALPEELSEVRPSTDHNLIGLAFAGGGIRSASFCLGVAQYLIKNRLFKYVDLLSTVSGGGYTGACLSALMHRGHDGERTLVDRDGITEPPALNHLRNGSNFLVPEGLFNRLRMPSLFVIGVLQTVLLFLPPIIFLVFLTELFFEVTGFLRLPFRPYLVATVGVLPLLAAVFLRPILQSRRRTWERRDRADRLMGIFLFLAIGSLVAVPILAGIDYVIDAEIASIIQGIRLWVHAHVQLGLGSWLLWLTAVLALLLLAGLIRFPATLLLWVTGVLGPLVLLSFYLLCCAYVITPDVTAANSAEYFQALTDYQKTGNTGDLETIVHKILLEKQHDPAAYRIAFDSIDRSDATDTELNVYRLADAPSPWWSRFQCLRYQDELTICRHPVRRHLALIPELSMLLRLRTTWNVYLAATLLWIFNYFFLNVNRTSLHPFYRDRLSRTFLIHRGDQGMEYVDKLRLSELGGEGSTAPYHLVNTALNLQGSHDPQLRQRKTVPFLLAKRFCGSSYTGYCETKRMEELDRNLDLGTAMAISAAAGGPTMGVKTVHSLAFILALLNVRLAYWLPHPGRVGRPTWVDWVARRHPGLVALLQEACGIVSDRGRFVNCSDGGHIENLGVYELLRRRCRTIICVDGGADPHFQFYDLTTLQRYAHIDLDVRIEIDPRPLMPDETGLSQEQFAIGTITYRGGEQGTLIYLKLSYSGDEPAYVRFYRRQVPAFPHEPTADQFFDETKFEVYRALGHHIATRAFGQTGIRDGKWYQP